MNFPKKGYTYWDFGSVVDCMFETAEKMLDLLKGLSEKVHIFRCCGFTKALLCIDVMSPLHRIELLV